MGHTGRHRKVYKPKKRKQPYKRSTCRQRANSTVNVRLAEAELNLAMNDIDDGGPSDPAQFDSSRS